MVFSPNRREQPIWSDVAATDLTAPVDSLLGNLPHTGCCPSFGSFLLGFTVHCFSVCRSFPASTLHYLSRNPLQGFRTPFSQDLLLALVHLPLSLTGFQFTSHLELTTQFASLRSFLLDCLLSLPMYCVAYSRDSFTAIPFDILFNDYRLALAEQGLGVTL